MDIQVTLSERGNRYGDFKHHARITQEIKQSFVNSPNWGILDYDQKEALEMTAHKIGRILNGDPNYHDSWHDIVGYIQLVADRLETHEQAVMEDCCKAAPPETVPFGQYMAVCEERDLLAKKLEEQRMLQAKMENIGLRRYR